MVGLGLGLPCPRGSCRRESRQEVGKARRPADGGTLTARARCPQPGAERAAGSARARDRLGVGTARHAPLPGDVTGLSKSSYFTLYKGFLRPSLLLKRSYWQFMAAVLPSSYHFAEGYGCLVVVLQQTEVPFECFKRAPTLGFVTKLSVIETKADEQSWESESFCKSSWTTPSFLGPKWLLNTVIL